MSVNHVKLSGPRWERVRRAVFRRDGYRCTKCGRPGRLEAHHEPPLRTGGDPYDLAGIVALCRACHVDRHRPDDMLPGRAAWVDFIEELV